MKHACDAALAEGISLADALAREPEVANRLDRAAIERLTDPAHYLGSADAFVDRVLQAAGAVVGRSLHWRRSVVRLGPWLGQADRWEGPH